MDLWLLVHPVLIELAAWLLGPTMLVLLLRGSGEVNGKAVVRSQLRALASRTWGSHHQLLCGTYLERNERELFRTEVRAMRVSAFNGQLVERRSSCILTDRRLIITDPNDGVAQVSLLDIRAIDTRRDYDPPTGFFSYVVIDRVSSPHGGLFLRCHTEEQCHDLMSRIQTAISYSRPMSKALMAALE
ncbi:MAG: hypothetical protein M3Z66_21765 [Chloroflexota bacterium]|nr:hypothetical protein [Chloroflexota bacterium]